MALFPPSLSLSREIREQPQVRRHHHDMEGYIEVACCLFLAVAFFGGFFVWVVRCRYRCFSLTHFSHLAQLSDYPLHHINSSLTGLCLRMKIHQYRVSLPQDRHSLAAQHEFGVCVALHRVHEKETRTRFAHRFALPHSGRWTGSGVV